MLVPVPAMPTIDAGRYWLRPFLLGDLPLIESAAGDAVVAQIAGVPSAYTDDEGRRYIERQWGVFERGEGYSFAIADAGTDEAVGQIVVRLRDAHTGRVQVEYWVLAAHRRRGAATEALRGLSIWALTLPGVERVELHVHPVNLVACRVAERVGFKAEGLLRSWQTVGKDRQDALMYSLLRSDRVLG